MSDEKKAGGDAPVFRLQKMYVKDLSFESPNAPKIFVEKTQPKAEMNLSLRSRKIDADHWEVAIKITASLKSGDTVVFIVEVDHAGLFLLQHIPEEHMPAVLAVECPTVLFPFTRQVVCQAVVDGGFMPFLVEPVNFLAMYQSSKKKVEGETAH